MVELSRELLLVFALVAIFLLASVIFLLMRLGRLSQLIRRSREDAEAMARERVGQSRAVLMGQVAEHFAPLLPGFGYQPKDARFLGQPVDFIVFNGLNDVWPTTEEGGRSAQAASSPPRNQTELELVFVEIKTGQSRLSRGERAIRDAIAAGRVRFETLRMQPDGRLEVEG